MVSNDISKKGLMLLKAKKDLLNFTCELNGNSFGIKELTPLNCRFAFNKGYLFFFYEEDYEGKHFSKNSNAKQITAYSINFLKGKKTKTVLKEAGHLYHTFNPGENYYPILEYVKCEQEFLGKGVGSYLCKFYEKLLIERGFYRFECVYGPDDQNKPDYRVNLNGQSVHRAYVMYEKNNYKPDYDDRGRILRYKILDTKVELEHKNNTASYSGLQIFAPFKMWQNPKNEQQTSLEQKENQISL